MVRARQRGCIEAHVASTSGRSRRSPASPRAGRRHRHLWRQRRPLYCGGDDGSSRLKTRVHLACNHMRARPFSLALGARPGSHSSDFLASLSKGVRRNPVPFPSSGRHVSPRAEEKGREGRGESSALVEALFSSDPTERSRPTLSLLLLFFSLLLLRRGCSSWRKQPLATDPHRELTPLLLLAI